MTTLQVQAPFTKVKIDIVRDADWFDSFPALLDGDGPLDLSLYGRVLNLYIRPTFDHATLIARYTSVDEYGTEGIFISDAEEGLAEIFVSRESHNAVLPSGSYDQFLVLTEYETLNPGLGTRHTEIWRGKLNVHPGLADVY